MATPLEYETLPQPRRLTRRNLLFGGGGVAALAMGGEAWSCKERLVVERRSLSLPSWKGPRLRIALLADLHANTKEEHARAMRAIELADAERPDLLAIAGDTIDRTTPYPRTLLGLLLDRLEAFSAPVVAVMGNHDYGAQDPQWTIDRFRQSRVRLLLNETADFDGFLVAGIDDALRGDPDFERLRHPRYADTTLVLLHEPDYVRRVPGHVGLVLSGHSHGGQVCLPGGIPVNLPLGGSQFVAGFYPSGVEPSLYVTRGVGTTGPRLRTFCPPEVSILTIGENG